MMIALHKNARTTPATRAEMAASSQTAATLALRYGVSEGTVYKWKGRDSFHDASHTPQRLQTTLTTAQEQIVVELRKTLLLPLDDLLAVTREFICPQATRSGLDRVFAATALAISTPSNPKNPVSLTKPSKATSRGSSTSMSNTCPRCPMKPAGGICLWPLTAPRAGCLFRSRATRRRLPLARF